MASSTTVMGEPLEGSGEQPPRTALALASGTVLDKAICRLTRSLAPKSEFMDASRRPGGSSELLESLGFQSNDVDEITARFVDCGARGRSGDFFANPVFDGLRSGFDGIVLHSPRFSCPAREISSMIYCMASWLRVDGMLVFATVPAETLLDDAALFQMKDDFVEDYAVGPANEGRHVTLVTTPGLLGMLQQAGLAIQAIDRGELEVDGEPGGSTIGQVVITARRTPLEPLFGPWPMPHVRRKPCELKEVGYEPFASRLKRCEFTDVLKKMQWGERVLEIGCGHGRLAHLMAQQAGKAWAVEPDDTRRAIAEARFRRDDSNVEILPGSAEGITHEAGFFSAIVACRVLHYVKDLEGAVAEMIRLLNADARHPRIVIVQAAPGNEIADLLNRVCIPMAAEDGESQGPVPLEHQGLVLATADRMFKAVGLDDISLRRVESRLEFPEEDVRERSEKAAEVLTNFWYKDHPKAKEMKEALLPILERKFRQGAKVIMDQGIMMVAMSSVRWEERSLGPVASRELKKEEELTVIGTTK